MIADVRKMSVVGQKPKLTLADTTWEERHSMTAAELILLMGDGWVCHARYQPRGKVRAPSCPLPNLANRQPTIEMQPPNTFWRLVWWYMTWLSS